MVGGSYRFRCNTVTRTTRLRDRLTSPVSPHRCHRLTGTSAGNRIPSAADNRRFQATCQLRYAPASSHWPRDGRLAAGRLYTMCVWHQ